MSDSRMLLASMDRGYRNLRVRNVFGSFKYILKYPFLSKKKNVSNSEINIFNFKELEAVFSNQACVLNVLDSVFLSRALFFVKISYLFQSSNVCDYFISKGLESLDKYFKADRIVVVNAGPSMLTPLLARYCELGAGKRVFVFVQHGIYQMNHMPYYFEIKYKQTRIFLWSKLLSERYISLGVESERIRLVPSYKINSIGSDAQIGKKILVIGESIDKIDKKFTEIYIKRINELLVALGNSYKFTETHYKHHPRSWHKRKYEEWCHASNIVVKQKIEWADYSIVIGSASSMLIEALCAGVQPIQLQIPFLGNNIDDFSNYSSAINIGWEDCIYDKLRYHEIGKALNLKKEYLSVDESPLIIYKNAINKLLT